MSRIVIKTIKGRRYRYLQRSYREDGRVRTESLYLGPVDGARRRGLLRRIGDLIEANRAEPGTRVMNQMIDAWQKQTQQREAAEKKAEQQFYDRMHALYGMTKGSSNPVPVEKVAPAPPIEVEKTISATPSTPSPAEAAATESPSAQGGAGAAEAAPSE